MRTSPCAVVLDLREFMGHLLDRRTFLSLGGGTAIAAAASPKLWGLERLRARPPAMRSKASWTEFTTVYMRAMDCPGMTQALTDTKATIRYRGLRLCQR